MVSLLVYYIAFQRLRGDPCHLRAGQTALPLCSKLRPYPDETVAGAKAIFALRHPGEAVAVQAPDKLLSECPYAIAASGFYAMDLPFALRQQALQRHAR